MDIFQRVKEIVFRFYKNEADFSRNMDVAAQTMNTWFKQKNEAKMLLLLKKILSCHTAINRDWLYFGEGEMLKESEETLSLLQRIESTEDITALQTKITELEAELAEERRLNRQLVTRLMKDC